MLQMRPRCPFYLFIGTRAFLKFYQSDYGVYPRKSDKSIATHLWECYIVETDQVMELELGEMNANE